MQVQSIAPGKLRQEFIANFPSWMLVLGAFLFGSQVSVAWWKEGGLGDVVLHVTAALVLLGGFLALGINIRYFWSQAPKNRITTLVGLALAAYFFLAFLSALKPSHLIQESDFLNYHLFLSKQYWIRGSWKPLEWSGFEFRFLGLQNAFSFLWLGLPLLNKLPQFLLVGFLVIRIGWIWKEIYSERFFEPWLYTVLAFFAFRGVNIQVGMAMLDLPVLYFFSGIILGVIEVLKGRDHAVSLLRTGVDLSFFCGQKSFTPFWLAIFCIVTVLSAGYFYRDHLRSFWSRLSWQKICLVLCPLVPLFLPNAARAFYYTGDAFFPMLRLSSQQFCQDSHLTLVTCEKILQLQAALAKIVGQYGYGHDFLAFIKSLFFLGLAFDGPTSVNNRFDYPLGLAWYFGLAQLIIWSIIKRGSQKMMRILLILASVQYFLWFAGSQQSRWLYTMALTLAFSFGFVYEQYKKWLSFVVVGLVFLLAINGAIIVRAQRHTISCVGTSCFTKEYLADYLGACPAHGALKVSELSNRGYTYCILESDGALFEYR